MSHDECNKIHKENETSDAIALGGIATIYRVAGRYGERILSKAFELWQERGYRDGHDLEDWLDAEAIVMEEIHEARE